MAFISDAQRRWFFANRGKVSSAPGAQLYKPGEDPVQTLIAQDEKAISDAIKKGNKIIAEDPQLAKKAQIANKQFVSGQDTKSLFYNKKENAYSPQRAQLHDEIIKEFDNPNAYYKDKQPQIIFLGGLPGSGKTSVITKFIKHVDDPNLPEHKAFPDHIYLNADNMKPYLPEYNGANALLLQDETFDIVDMAIQKYAKEGKNMIVDSTLKSITQPEKRIDALQKMGYEVILYATNIKGETAIDRAAKRFRKTGRYVSLEMIGGAAERINENVLKLRHKVDKYKILNTNLTRENLSQPPKLIESDASVKSDRAKTSKNIVFTEKEWRDKGTGKTDLIGYDTEEHEKVNPE